MNTQSAHEQPGEEESTYQPKPHTLKLQQHVVVIVVCCEDSPTNEAATACKAHCFTVCGSAPLLKNSGWGKDPRVWAAFLTALNLLGPAQRNSKEVSSSFPELLRREILLTAYLVHHPPPWQATQARPDPNQDHELSRALFTQFQQFMRTEL